MQACKHEIADGLIPLGRGNLDRAHFGTRQPDLEQYLLPEPVPFRAVG